MTAPLSPDAIEALCEFYLKYWHETGTYESDQPRYSLIENGDMLALDEICERIEPHEQEIRAFVAAKASAP